MNSVNLVGNISTEIDLRATSTGKFVAKFNLAVNNPFNKEKTNFLPVEVWGTTAQNTANFCDKGSKISVTGYLDVESWEKDGRKNYKTKVVADRIGFLDSKKKDGQQPAPKQQTKQDNDPFSGQGQINISDDDLPF